LEIYQEIATLFSKHRVNEGVTPFAKSRDMLGKFSRTFCANVCQNKVPAVVFTDKSTKYWKF